jgi:hypothetical protein
MDASDVAQIKQVVILRRFNYQPNIHKKGLSDDYGGPEP